jgi:hypothetical protein
MGAIIDPGAWKNGCLLTQAEPALGFREFSRAVVYQGRPLRVQPFAGMLNSVGVWREKG